MLKAAVAEALAVAHAKGIPVAGDMVDDVARAYQALPPRIQRRERVVEQEDGCLVHLLGRGGRQAEAQAERGRPRLTVAREAPGA